MFRVLGVGLHEIMLRFMVSIYESSGSLFNFPWGPKFDILVRHCFLTAVIGSLPYDLGESVLPFYGLGLQERRVSSGPRPNPVFEGMYNNSRQIILDS